MLGHYINSLSAAMEGMVETEQANSEADAEARCVQWKPDVVHLHGAMAEKLSQKARCIVTPHGQELTSTRAYAIVARSEMERKRLLKAGLKRVEVIRNPVITRTTTFSEAARQYCDIYRRVSDSNVRQLMSDNTLFALHRLLKVAIMGDRRWVENDTEENEVDWRQLQIYAWQEGVSDELRRGAEIMELTMPAIDAAAVKSFLPYGYKRPEKTGEHEVATLLEIINDEISKHEMSLCRIVELHQALADNSLDEDRLMSTIDGNRRRLLQRLLFIAQTETLLDVGYMPAEPLNDRTTKNIYQTLINHQQL